MIVVSDTSPICYLVLIGQIDLLHRLFERVVVPRTVWDELRDPASPAALLSWVAAPPAWLEVREARTSTADGMDDLHPGERDAITLAEQLGADLILLDEKAARSVARRRGLTVTGLLGVVDEAASRGHIDIFDVVARLQQTTFRASPGLLKALLDRHAPR